MTTYLNSFLTIGKKVRVLVLLVIVVGTSNALSEDISIEADVVYGHKAGMALTYDVLVPQNAHGAGVLFMVSGGWFSIWRPPQQFANWIGYLLDEGFTVFPVRHGSAPWFKVPEAVDDVRRAVRHIRMNADSYGVDPERLGVMGGSAGGHLSLMLGLQSDSGDAESDDPVAKVASHVAAVVAYFPPTDLRGMAGPSDRFPALDFQESREPSVSPLLFVTEDDPPVLLIHGDEDKLVPISHSYQLRDAMDELELEVSLHVIEGAAHGFRGEHQATAQQLTVAHFAEHLSSNEMSEH